MSHKGFKHTKKVKKPTLEDRKKFLLDAEKAIKGKIEKHSEQFGKLKYTSPIFAVFCSKCGRNSLIFSTCFERGIIITCYRCGLNTISGENKEEVQEVLKKIKEQ